MLRKLILGILLLLALAFCIGGAGAAGLWLGRRQGVTQATVPLPPAPPNEALSILEVVPASDGTCTYTDSGEQRIEVTTERSRLRAAIPAAIIARIVGETAEAIDISPTVELSGFRATDPPITLTGMTAFSFESTVLGGQVVRKRCEFCLVEDLRQNAPGSISSLNHAVIAVMVANATYHIHLTWDVVQVGEAMDARDAPYEQFEGAVHWYGPVRVQ